MSTNDQGKAEQSTMLELQALLLMRQYGFLLPRPVKEFLRELAAHLNWQKLEKVL